MSMKINVLSFAVVVCSVVSVSASDRDPFSPANEAQRKTMENKVGAHHFIGAPTGLKNQILDNLNELERRTAINNRQQELVDIMLANPTQENQDALRDFMEKNKF